MQTITLYGHVNSDGTLQLQLPHELQNQTVSITIRTLAAKPDRNLGVALGWPEGFFAQTAGCLADDDSFFRHPQGDYETREPLE